MTPATLKFRLCTWNNAKDILIPLRNGVFIKEQQVPEELEWDHYDNKSNHILLILNNCLYWMCTFNFY